jgi:hypothetical protein
MKTIALEQAKSQGKTDEILEPGKTCMRLLLSLVEVVPAISWAGVLQRHKHDHFCVGGKDREILCAQLREQIADHRRFSKAGQLLSQSCMSWYDKRHKVRKRLMSSKLSSL